MTGMSAVRTLRCWIGRDDGQDLLEYGLLTSLIVIVAMAGVRSVGAAINSIFWEYIGSNF